MLCRLCLWFIPPCCSTRLMSAMHQGAGTGSEVARVLAAAVEHSWLEGRCYRARGLQAGMLHVQASQMNYKNGQAQGFALFHSGAAARAAVDQLHNMV